MPDAADDLRERCRVAERVGQPRLAGVDAELLEEEALARDELPRHRLAAGQVRVGLHPHAADGDELARVATFVLDPLEQLGVAAPSSTRTAARTSRRNGTRDRHPSARARSRTCARTCGSSRGWATAMPSRCARGRWRRRCGCSPEAGSARAGARASAAGARRRVHIVGVDDVDHPLERAEDAVPARRLCGQLLHEPRRASRRPAMSSHTVRSMRTASHCRSTYSSSSPEVALVTQLRRLPGPVAGDVRVGRALDVEVDGAAALLRHREVAAARVDRLDGGAVRTEGEPLDLEARTIVREAEVDDELGTGGRLGRRGATRGGSHPSRGTMQSTRPCPTGTAHRWDGRTARPPLRTAPARPGRPTPRSSGARCRCRAKEPGCRERIDRLVPL